MPRNIRANALDSTPRAVIAVGNDHLPGARSVHTHRRSQLLCTITGVVTLWTEQGSWVAPPKRAVWIPAGVPHAIRMSGPASTCSVYVQASVASRRRLPGACCVVAVSPLLQALVREAVDLPLLYDPAGRDGRVMSLILDELAALQPAMPLHVPLPADARLARVCAQMLAQPTGRIGLDALASQLGMSRSTFVRHFRASTGMSFGTWQRQALLLAALERLGAGEPVTRVALDLGYDSPSAFTVQFKRALGVTPSRYFG